ncbi:MAG: glycosyltransferase [Bacillota bacterium]
MIRHSGSRPAAWPAHCLPYEQAARVYSSGRIVLGLQFDNSSMTQTSCRVLEVLGSGRFHLAPHTPATAARFRNGVHLALSASPPETLDMARYYLARPASRQKIAQAGREHVLAHHTYKHRAAQMLEPVRTVIGKGEALCAQ